MKKLLILKLAKRKRYHGGKSDEIWYDWFRENGNESCEKCS